MAIASHTKQANQERDNEKIRYNLNTNLLVKSYMAEIINSLLKAISTSVNGPLTLIAFIVVCFLAALLFTLKETKGLKKAQELLFKDASLKEGEFLKLVKIVLSTLLFAAAMLFALLFYDYSSKTDFEKTKLQAESELQKVKLQTDFEKTRLQTESEREKAKRQSGLTCYADSCTGRDPKDSSCDKGADTITSKIASFPELGDNYKNVKLEIRYSARCNANWVKASPVIGATVYLESKDGNKHVSLVIKDDGIAEPHFTDMLSGEIEKRACISYPNYETQCTSFIRSN